jgi:hypothetical protein
VSKRGGSTLREFIYLDDVSVYSLIASRLGPVATEFTESERASLQGEVGSGISSGAPSIAKAQIDARVVATQSRESQVLKKSIVQTTFKELYDLESDSLALRPPARGAAPPLVETLDTFARTRDSLIADRWIIDPADLCRGQLLDMDVTLEAEGVFQVSAVVSAMLDMLEGTPGIFDASAYRSLGDVRSVGRVLEKLLVGLVPIRGRSSEYMVLADLDRVWLVHRRLADTLGGEVAVRLEPLYVVGVAEQALFWRDIRRVLFSESQFRVFSRLARSGIHASWTPVKLADVLETVVPGVGRQIAVLGSGTLLALSAAGTQPGEEGLRKERFSGALADYAGLIAKHYGHSIAAEDLIEAGLPSEQNCTSYSTLMARREAFDEMAQFVCKRFRIDQQDRLILAQYRQTALLDAGLDLNANLSAPVRSLADLEYGPPKGRYLDTEFVAIYW